MLKAILLRKKLADANGELAALTGKDYATRESELASAIDEATTPDERKAVEDAVNAFETEKRDDEKKAAELKESIAEMEKELSELEAKVEDTAPDAEKDDAGDVKAVEPTDDNDAPDTTTRTKENITMEKRFKDMTTTEKRDFCKREDVSAFLTRVKESGLEKRAISGGALLIPEVVLPMLREVAYKTSKLVKYVAVKPVKGVARQTVAGTIPEAVWTEACGILNELSFSFNGVEVDGYKVGGFVPVCNALLADSDIDLMNAIIEGIGAAIGIALDKAILYGTGVKMPEGIVTRLAQTAQPADYPTTARPWVDLHTSNIKTIANTVHGVDFFKALVDAIANAMQQTFIQVVNGILGITFALMHFGTDIDRVESAVQMTEKGVDSMETITLFYKDGRMAVLTHSIYCRSDRKGIIHGDKGYMVVENINNPQSLSVYDTEDCLLASYDFSDQISGYEFEFREAVRQIRAGKIESDSMPFGDTLYVMDFMDSLRKDWGMVYPQER